MTTAELVQKPAASPPPVTASTDVALMFERLATNPDVDVAKLEKLIAMQERILAHNAKAAFDAAFVEMRPHIPTIIERARTDKTTYAPLEDIVEVVTPVLSKFGFSLSFRTEWPAEKLVKVVGMLTHAQGHVRESEFQSGADKTGSKNDIQSLASTVSYGKRYTTNDLLCIVTRGQDVDGERSVSPSKPAAPEGFEAWLLDMTSLADEGTERLQATWIASKPPYRTYLTRYEPARWLAIKAKAAKVGVK